MSCPALESQESRSRAPPLPLWGDADATPRQNGISEGTHRSCITLFYSEVSECAETVKTHLKNLSAWQLSALPGGHATSHTAELCVYWSQHLHYRYLLGKSIFTAHVILQATLLPGACSSGGTSCPRAISTAQPQSQALQEPHLGTGCTSTRERGEEHPESLPLETAGPCLAFEEGWSLGKRSGRVFTGCIWTSGQRETTPCLRW